MTLSGPRDRRLFYSGTGNFWLAPVKSGFHPWELNGNSMKILTTPRMDRCIGCHSCSLACARLLHQRLSWETAGIRIQSSGGLTTGFTAVHCLVCDPPPCAAVCPTGAFAPRKGGGVIVRKKLCNRCGACATTCPVDAVFIDQDGEPFVCVHCGRCVPFCPHDCLELAEPDSLSPASKNVPSEPLP